MSITNERIQDDLANFIPDAIKGPNCGWQPSRYPDKFIRGTKNETIDVTTLFVYIATNFSKNIGVIISVVQIAKDKGGKWTRIGSKTRTIVSFISNGPDNQFVAK